MFKCSSNRSKHHILESSNRGFVYINRLIDWIIAVFHATVYVNWNEYFSTQFSSVFSPSFLHLFPFNVLRREEKNVAELFCEVSTTPTTTTTKKRPQWSVEKSIQLLKHVLSCYSFARFCSSKSSMIIAVIELRFLETCLLSVLSVQFKVDRFVGVSSARQID